MGFCMNIKIIIYASLLGISTLTMSQDDNLQEVDVPTDTIQVSMSPYTASDSFNFDAMTDTMERYEEEHDIDFGAVKDIPEWQVWLRRVFTPVFMRYVLVHQYLKERLHKLALKVGLYGS